MYVQSDTQKSLSQQQGQLTLSSIPAAVPCYRYPLWDSFAMQHFAALVVEKVPIFSHCSSKSTVRALLLRDGFRVILAAKAEYISDIVICAEQWQAAVITSCGFQCVATLHQLVCLWLWSSELAVEWGGSAWQVLPFGGTREASAKHLLLFPCWGNGWRLLLFTSKYQLMKPLKSVGLWICFLQTVKFSATSTPCPRFRV